MQWLVTIFVSFARDPEPLQEYAWKPGGLSRHYCLLKNKPIGRCSHVTGEGNICQGRGDRTYIPGKFRRCLLYKSRRLFGSLGFDLRPDRSGGVNNGRLSGLVAHDILIRVNEV